MSDAALARPRFRLSPPRLPAWPTAIATALIVPLGLHGWAIAALHRQGVERLGCAGRTRGGKWTATLLLGGAARETGMLRNRLYVGERVWNRQHFVKDPSTGRRVARPNPRAAWVVTQVPELAVLDREIWEAAQRRLEAVGGP